MWEIRFEDEAIRVLKRLDRASYVQIIKYLNKILESGTDPTSFGKPLLANRKGLWRYRVGDYRIICKIQDNELLILVLGIGHRSEVYK